MLFLKNVTRCAGRMLMLGLCLQFMYGFALLGRAQQPRPIWVQSLAANPYFATRETQDGLLIRPPRLEFLDQARIIVAFDDGVCGIGNAKQSEFHFHVLEISALSGSAGHHLSFPVTADTSEVRAIADDGFLVLAGEELQKRSASFQKVFAVPTPLRLHGKPTRQVMPDGTVYWNPRYERWTLDVAPGGNAALLGHSEGPGAGFHLEWLSSNDLSHLKTFDTRVWKDIYATNQGAIFIDPLKVSILSHDVVRPFCVDCAAYPIDDDLLFVDRQTKYSLVSLSGGEKAHGRLSVYADHLARARDASRFVYATGKYGGYGLPLVGHFTDVYVEIRVFDWKRMQQVFEIRLHKPVGAESHGYKHLTLALSPDGTHLAVLDGAELSLYRIP